MDISTDPDPYPPHLMIRLPVSKKNIGSMNSP